MPSKIVLWTLVVAALVVGIVLLATDNSAPRNQTLASCDVYFQNSLDGICLIKTDGHGNRVKYTQLDNEVVLEHLLPNRQRDVLTSDGPKSVYTEE